MIEIESRMGVLLRIGADPIDYFVNPLCINNRRVEVDLQMLQYSMYHAILT